MAQIFWEQISNTLPQAGETLTGSLSINGSLYVNGIDLYDVSIFRRTGSYYATTNDIQLTGSLYLNLNGIDDQFTVSVGGQEKVKVTTEGTIKFISQSVTPSLETGGLFYSSSNEFYLGFN